MPPHRLLPCSLSSLARHVRFSYLPRSFTTAATLLSGHSRWSKIKHDKGKADGAKSKSRQLVVQELTVASRHGGPDPTLNARLAQPIAAAKKLGLTKDTIEAAIARGQGLSLSGAALEQVTIDFMIPDLGIAGLVECQTDSKSRTLNNVKETLKHHGATATPAAYMFDRRGRIVFKQGQGKSWDEESVLDKAIESGAEDVDVDEDEVEVLTQPSEMAVVADALSAQLSVKPESQELVWIPKPDALVELNQESQDTLQKIIDGLAEEPSVQEVYHNA